MNGGKRSAGYTIIEVMIVLAVTGFMFVIAANIINGKQQKTAFQQGVNEMASRLQGLIEQVADGQYSDVLQTCSFTPSGGGGTITITDPVTPPPSTNGVDNDLTQGSNPNCVFLGKMLHLRVGDRPSDYEALSLVGGRVNSTGQPITQISASGARVSDLLTHKQTIPQNLEVAKVKAYNSSGSLVTSYAIGFLQGLGSTDAALPNTLKSGAQSIGLYYDNALTSASTALNYGTSANLASRLTPTVAAEICLTDGTRWARVQVGTSNSALNVRVQMDGTTMAGDCA
jgi:type II secretory pathway pseudopilin PulG